MLTRVENNWDLYGLKKESARHAKYREIARKYNRLARKGMDQGQIAEVMGFDKKYLASLAHRIKEAGIPIIPLTKRAAGAPVPKPTVVKQQRANRHGGGRWGIRGCICDLCVNVRRKTRAEIDAGRAAAGLPPRKH